LKKIRRQERIYIVLVRIQIILENSTRKLGINLSIENGYIVFIDDDNIIFPNYLSTFNKNIETQQMFILILK